MMMPRRVNDVLFFLVLEASKDILELPLGVVRWGEAVPHNAFGVVRQELAHRLEIILN